MTSGNGDRGAGPGCRDRHPGPDQDVRPQTVFEDVTCDLPRGKITVILGPSGTGKSVFPEASGGPVEAGPGQHLATSQGTVRTVVVHRLGEDTASAFGVVDETVTNSASPEPRTEVLREVLRVELGLIETSEAWKVERVEILQAPSTAPTG
jgi:ABC-type phosphate/phosphonate transport system ATPase subunit